MLEIDGVTGDIQHDPWDALARAKYSCDRPQCFCFQGGAVALVRAKRARIPFRASATAKEDAI